MTTAVARIFDHAFMWQLDFPMFLAATEVIAAAASYRWAAIRTVIGIGGGGIPAAVGVAWHLHARLDIVQARHNVTDAAYTAATGHVATDATAVDPLGLAGDVLLVDDICGTGATLEHVGRVLRTVAHRPLRVHTAVLCRNAGAPVYPDIVVWDHLREWVAFPWETSPPPDAATRKLPPPRQAPTA